MFFDFFEMPYIFFEGIPIFFEESPFGFCVPSHTSLLNPDLSVHLAFLSCISHLFLQIFLNSITSPLPSHIPKRHLHHSHHSLCISSFLSLMHLSIIYFLCFSCMFLYFIFSYVSRVCFCYCIWLKNAPKYNI